MTSDTSTDDIERLREFAKELQEDRPEKFMESVNTEASTYTGCSGAFCMGLQTAGRDLEDLLDELEQSTETDTE